MARRPQAAHGTSEQLSFGAPPARAARSKRATTATPPAHPALTLARLIAQALDDPQLAELVRQERASRDSDGTSAGERLESAREMGALLGIPAKTVLQYARGGRLPCRQVGKHVRFVRSEVLAAIDRGPI